jgi:hypothetical protein
MRSRLIFLGLVALVAGCDRPVSPPPPRLTSPAVIPQTMSRFTVPVTLPLPKLEAALDRGAPGQLWSIDEKREDCIPAQRPKILGTRIKVSPDIGCRIVGQVMRGRIRLIGRGDEILIRMPVEARVSARDVGGVLKGETATAAAEVRARVRLALDKSWRLRGRIEIDYDWKEPPGIDFLGRRIRFVKRADRALANVIAGLERQLEAELARVPVRRLVEGAWREGFLVIELNRARPPAWMRITPEALGVTSLSARGDQLRLDVSGRALTETFIGEEAPPKPALRPLPPAATGERGAGFDFAAPVLADYSQLELSARGIRLGRLGRVEALFDQVIIYPTAKGRLAVGVRARVRRLDPRVPGLDLASKGTVWLTGFATNEPNSRVIKVNDLAISGRTDNRATNLLFGVLDAPETRASIAEALTQNLERDYQKVLTAATKAIGDRRLGGFRLQAQIAEVRHGPVQATGSGLLLTVTARGTARLDYAAPR